MCAAGVGDLIIEVRGSEVMLTKGIYIINSAESSARPERSSLTRCQRYVAILLGAMMAAMAMLAASVAASVEKLLGGQ